MAKDRRTVQHIKSNVTVTENGITSAKKPNKGTLLPGEIAVNYAAGYESISLENSSGEVISITDKIEIGENTPKRGNTEIFIDTSADADSTVEIYSKADVDKKITVGTDENNGITTQLFIDTDDDSEVRTYNKGEIDALIASLQAQIDELKNK